MSDEAERYTVPGGEEVDPIEIINSYEERCAVFVFTTAVINGNASLVREMMRMGTGLGKDTVPTYICYDHSIESIQFVECADNILSIANEEMSDILQNESN